MNKISKRIKVQFYYGWVVLSVEWEGGGWRKEKKNITPNDWREGELTRHGNVRAFSPREITVPWRWCNGKKILCHLGDSFYTIVVVVLNNMYIFIIPVGCSNTKNCIVLSERHSSPPICRVENCEKRARACGHDDLTPLGTRLTRKTFTGKRTRCMVLQSHNTSYWLANRRWIQLFYFIHFSSR